MKLIKIITAFFICNILLIACKKRPLCELPDEVSNSSIQVIFKDSATGNFLYPEDSPLNNYNIDSIEIYNQNNTKLYLINGKYVMPNYVASFYWEVNFGPIYDYRTDSISFQHPIKRYFLVKYNAWETDTIKTEFKSSYTTCGSVFDYLRIYYKDKLIDSITNSVRKKITIKKY